MSLTDNPNPYLGPNEAGIKLLPKRKRMFSVWSILLWIFLAVILIGMLLPVTRRGMPEAARRSTCQNNLRQIAIALLNYESHHGTLPPAYTVDAEGNRLHSWRTLILPFLEENLLYESIDLTKPWNDPVNAKAYETSINIFNCPSVKLPAGHTSYLAIVAPEGCFGGTQPRRLSEISDGTSKTIMVIEVAREQAVHWMSPEDADEAMVLGLGKNELKLPHSGIVLAVYVEGSTHSIPTTITTEQRRALISVAGNEPIDLYEY